VTQLDGCNDDEDDVADTRQDFDEQDFDESVLILLFP
jgi:hypothetical protein